MIPNAPNINQHPDDYHMSSRKRQHRIHYSRIKSAAIAASYRLMHVSTDNVLVRKTANAAVNGMRPEYVKAAQEHKQQVEPDIVPDNMYNHKTNIEAICDLCLVQEPRRNRDDFKPPEDYEFVLLSTLSQENKPKPILCGSGEKYYLCFRRRVNLNQRAITDIQITFKSTIPLGYQPLNYLFDGTELPYFQRKEETEQKQQEQQENEPKNNNNSKIKNNNNDKSPNSNNNLNGKNQSKNSNLNSNSNNLQKTSSSNNKNRNKDNNNNSNHHHNEQEENNNNINGQQQDINNNEEKEVVSFDNIPLIIFSKTGESQIIDVQLKELGTKLREGLISVDRSLDDNVANLNKGTADTTIHPIYISYANDLIAYRFSPNDLNRHINLKFLTPLLISLHLRKADLAMTAIDSLKYLLLSNFVRFRDHDIMITALKKICAAVSHSVVTWNTSYHDKLMEIQIIIFQKFIHHLPAQQLWSMLVSSLIPLKYDLPKKFLKKYIETSFSYIRILEFGDSLDETGNVRKQEENNQHQQQQEHKQENKQKPNHKYTGSDRAYFKFISNTKTPQSPQTPQTPLDGINQPPMAFGQYVNGNNNNNNNSKIKIFNTEQKCNSDDNGNNILFFQMKNFVNNIVDKAINKGIAEKSLAGFYQTDSFSVGASQYVGSCCNALFITDREKPWKPLSCMIIFLCRMALSPSSSVNVARLRERSCRYCTRLLEKIIDTACNEEYVLRMPSSFKYLLRRTISRTICYNLCNQNYERYEDIFNANLRFFEKICLNWYSFFQHEIGVILTQVILPQVLERFTPFRRRQKFLSCISRILQHDKTLIELVYSLDIINGTRCIHGIVDSLMGILVETAAILKHDKPTFEIADQSAKSYTNNYNFHHLAIQCLTYLCKSYSTWFNNEIIKKNWSSSYLSQCVMDATFGFTEGQWQKWMHFHQTQLKAKEIACNVDEDKAVKHAIQLLLDEKYIRNTSESIASWLHQNRYDIPASNIGDFLGGSRPKNERPLEEEIRCTYIMQCDLNFYAPIEIVMQFFLTKCGFRLPSEAQKIERVLESFADVYYHSRSEIWANADAVFIVFNAILMLNTSLHNPRIKEKDKLKKSVFLGMCMGVKGQSFTKSDYERVYNYIEKNAFEIKFEDEVKMANLRQFDEWKKKNLQAARRPLLAFTQELKKEMKKVGYSSYHTLHGHHKLNVSTGNLDRSKSMNRLINKRQQQHGLHQQHLSNIDTTAPLQKSYTFNGVSTAAVSTPNVGIGSMEFNEDQYGIANIDNYTTPENPDDDGFFDDEEDTRSSDKVKNNMNNMVDEQEDDDDDDDDEKEIDDEQKEIEKQMRETFVMHSVASLKEDAAEYSSFCEELRSKAFWWLGCTATVSSDLIYCENSVELGCLLIDNWWPRILDALKIVFELNDDPYTTPLVLSILPHFLQITLTLGAFGHEPCKIAFNGILTRYKTWWLSAIERMDEALKSKNTTMAKESDLKLIFDKIWEKPQKYYEKLKSYILVSQHVVHSRTIWLRLRDLQFEFSDVHFMLRGREFIGEQTILKMGARDTTYRLFFFNDMLLYANGRPGKYRSHRVLLLIFCALEDLKDSRNVTNAFRIHSPQKSITIALPNSEYKRICFKKINELIVKQRKKVRQLIQELLRKHNNNNKQNEQQQQNGDKYLKLAEKFQTSSAFLHQTIESIENNKLNNLLPNNCKLCLTAFNRMGRRKKECPICNDNVCPKCIQRKARNPKTTKRRNVCDGCLDIVEGRLRL